MMKKINWILLCVGVLNLLQQGSEWSQAADRRASNSASLSFQDRVRISEPKLIEKDKASSESFPIFEATLSGSKQKFRFDLKKVDNLFSKDFAVYTLRKGRQILEKQRVETDCLYQGQVEGDSTSKVVLSYCDGIISGSIFTQSQEWVISPELRDAKEQTLFRRSDNIKNSGDCGTKDFSPMISNQSRYEGQSLEPTTRFYPEPESFSQSPIKYIKVILVSDQQRFLNFQKNSQLVLASTRAIAAQLQSIYLQIPPSAMGGFQAKVQIVGIVSVENSPDPWGPTPLDGFGEVDPSSLLTRFNQWRTLQQNTLPENTATHLISGFNFSGNIIGLTALGAACDNSLATGVSQGIGADAFVAKTVAHELGHSIGMRHTNVYLAGTAVSTPNDTIPCTQNPLYVMNASITNTQFAWDACSPQWFEMFLQGFPYDCSGSACTYARIYGSSDHLALCMETPSSESPLGPICGNGIVEGKEVCDCGTAAQCAVLDPCCDSSTCQLKTSSRCSALEPCCDRNTCSPVSASKKQVCRASKSECDLAEYCDGVSSQCPEDRYFPLGKTCQLTLVRPEETVPREGICFQGQCQSHEQECLNLLQNGLYVVDGECSRAGDSNGDLACGKLYCKNQGSDYCSTSFYAPNLLMVPDGTPCGPMQACFNQKCMDYGPQPSPMPSPSPSPIGPKFVTTGGYVPESTDCLPSFDYNNKTVYSCVSFKDYPPYINPQKKPNPPQNPVDKQGWCFIGPGVKYSKTSPNTRMSWGFCKAL